MANPAPTTSRLDSPASAATRPTAATVVALTGVLGVFGSRLLRDLLEDTRVEKVICLDLKAPNLTSPKLTHVDIDLTSSEIEQSLGAALADHHVDCVAHLAFRDGPSPYPGHSHELESIGTMRIVQACLQARVRKLLLWSRSWVYGASPNAPALLDEQRSALARRSERFFADKIDAERDVMAFRAPGRGRLSTVLRMAPVVDPTAKTHVMRLLADRRVPSILGFDPMWQLLHIEDASRAMQQAIFRDGPAIVNVASTGAVPLSVARSILGASPIPLPRSVASILVGGLWLTGVGHIPPSLLDYLQFSCVADCSLARQSLKFEPKHDTFSILQQAAQASSFGAAVRSPA